MIFETLRFQTKSVIGTKDRDTGGALTSISKKLLFCKIWMFSGLPKSSISVFDWDLVLISGSI